MFKYFKFFFFYLFISCSSQASLAQTDGSEKAKKIYIVADEAAAFGRYDEALEGFHQALQLDPRYIDAHLRVAFYYQNLYLDYTKATIHYESVVALDETLYKAYYELGRCYASLQDYEKALKFAQKYLDEANLSENGKWQASLLIESIVFAKSAVNNPVSYEPVNLGPNVNSDKSEYFPSITADNEWLYFTVNDPSTRYPNEDIYAAHYLDGKWMERKPITHVNNADSQEGAHSVTQDGRYLFFASDRMEGNLGKFDIYIAKKVGDEWMKPMNLGNVLNTRYWESQPVISSNSKQIFFVRKSSDGFGGSDIYVSNLESNGRFGTPVNLGNVINTPGDEQRPYLHPDGKTLYFASNGHPGMGKTDVFKTVLNEDGNWGKPQNLGYPLNSVEVEFGLYVASDGKTAYISSDREGGFGDMDIYSFEMPASARPELVVSVKGIVRDAETSAPLKADIQILDLKSGLVYKTLSTDESNGSFLLTLVAGRNYAYVASLKGYLPYSENFTLESIVQNDLVTLEALMQKIEKGKAFTLRNVFFNSGEFALLDESKVELDFLVDFLKQDSSLFLEVGGHTDSDGSEASNILLSENRAKAVYQYLINQGISEKRISFKGYGEREPLVPNDGELNKWKNRRTAFRVQ
jgi:outer membrane protein OmpA-like peptidoglycan-associated protein/tetratricopeptide (TPR) repeat protein